MKELEPRAPQERLQASDDRHPDVFLPGSGFAKHLYSEWSVLVTLLSLCLVWVSLYVKLSEAYFI